MELHHKQLVKIQKQEKEKLEKQQRQEVSYMKFKDWLKYSLIRQREQQMAKRIEKQSKKMKEEEEKRNEAHRRVMAKIAYKDWKQTKMEEEKLKKKREKMQRRQGMFDPPRGPGVSASVSNFRANSRNKRKFDRHNSARAIQPSEMSSRYINTDQKREQISTRGG